MERLFLSMQAIYLGLILGEIEESLLRSGS